MHCKKWRVDPVDLRVHTVALSSLDNSNRSVRFSSSIIKFSCHHLELPAPWWVCKAQPLSCSSQASDQSNLSQIHPDPSLKPYSLCHASSRTALAKFHRVGELNGRYLCKLVAVNMSRFCDTWLASVIERDIYKWFRSFWMIFRRWYTFLWCQTSSPGLFSGGKKHIQPIC